MVLFFIIFENVKTCLLVGLTFAFVKDGGESNLVVLNFLFVACKWLFKLIRCRLGLPSVTPCHGYMTRISNLEKII